MNWMRTLSSCALIFLASQAMAQTSAPTVEVVQSYQSAPSLAEAKQWNYNFASLKDFLALIQRPSLKILASGETADFFYAIGRHEQDLYMAVAPRRGGNITKFSIDQSNVIGGPTGIPEGLASSNPAGSEIVTLVKTSVKGTPANVPPNPMTVFQHDLQAIKIPLSPSFHGSFNLWLKVSNDSFDNATVSPHVVWN